MKLPDRQVTVAVVQTSPVFLDLDKSIAKLRAFTADAAAQGAQLVLFPEAFLSGYPRGSTFGARIGSRTGEGRDWFLRYWQSSVDLPDSGNETLAEIAREFRVFLVVGVVERDRSSLYCTIAYFGPDGAFLGKHRKLVATAAERIVWAHGDGKVEAYATDIGVIGGLVCWENRMPLARMALYEQGIEIYCAPTADSRDEWTSTLRHIACEGRCYVLGCNQFFTHDDYPADYIAALTSDEEITSRGGSCIVDPYGRIIAGPVFDSEALLVASIDRDEIVRSKLDFDVAGHYARPDVFVFSVRSDGRPSTS